MASILETVDVDELRKVIGRVAQGRIRNPKRASELLFDLDNEDQVRTLITPAGGFALAEIAYTIERHVIASPKEWKPKADARASRKTVTELAIELAEEKAKQQRREEQRPPSGVDRGRERARRRFGTAGG